MRLSDWLSSSRSTHAGLASRIGVHPVTVAKWAAGTMIPRREAMQRIEAATDGAVQPNDFFGGEPARTAPASSPAPAEAA